MKTAIIISHCIGISACAAAASSLPDKYKVVGGFVGVVANGIGVYLSSVYKTGDPSFLAANNK